ncbi:hypothetical protein [Flavobacterium aquidurense]|uniref:hypothetical protein n=1 Tax=Flavobacterium aquidurense TaxID=362413 RepID=UPI00285FAF94|nr:hypothetical protein [Flavobacterium aquidurense]MDR7369417.1 hypothetical protein [Flavobacterium aquidurense]
MKNHQQRSLFLLIFGLFLNFSTIYSQTNADISTYKWFDQAINDKDLDIINGTLHTNPYRTVGENNMYYIDDKYESGILIYENQAYYNVKLKYDIYRDILVLNPPQASENMGLNVISSKVQSFSIKGKTFIRIDRKDNAVPEFSTGYYEENKIASDFIFYIKHHKDQQKGINDGGVYYIYKENTSFFLDLKNKIYKINDKSDVVNLFPEQKKQINGFYLMNRELKKSDLNQFMTNLMKYINNSISVQTK